MRWWSALVALVAAACTDAAPAAKARSELAVLEVQDSAPRECVQDAPIAAPVWVGRSRIDGEARVFSWAGSGVRVHASGEIELELRRTGDSMFVALVDGAPTPLERVQRSKHGRTRVERWRVALPPGAHELELIKHDEPRFGTITLDALHGALLPARARPLLEVIGDSISVGFGNAKPKDRPCTFAAAEHDATRSYAAQLARALDMDLSLVAVSSKTTRQMTTLFERAEPDRDAAPWDFAASRAPALVVVLLGTNDFFQRDPGESTFVHDYQALLGTLRERYGREVPVVAALSPMLSDAYPFGARHRALGARYLQRAVEALGDPHVHRVELDEPTREEGLGCSAHPSVATHTRMTQQLLTLIEQEQLVTR